MLMGIRVYSIATCLVALLVSAFWSRVFGAALWLEDALFLVPQVTLTVVVSILVSKKLPAGSPGLVLVLEMLKAVLFWVALGWAWLNVPWYDTERSAHSCLVAVDGRCRRAHSVLDDESDAAQPIGPAPSGGAPVRDVVKPSSHRAVDGMLVATSAAVLFALVSLGLVWLTASVHLDESWRSVVLVAGNVSVWMCLGPCGLSMVYFYLRGFQLIRREEQRGYSTGPLLRVRCSSSTRGRDSSSGGRRIRH